MKLPFSNSQLALRVISALVAIGFLYFSYYLLENTGIVLASALCIGLAIWELSQLLFVHIISNRMLMWLFLFVCAILFPAACFADGWEFSALALGISVFSVTSLWLTREKISAETLLRSLALASLGFTYGVVFPSFAVKILMHLQGIRWFVCMLALTFAGDTFSYFGGKIWGRSKLMPSLSPKKTIEGAFAGGLVAILAAIILGRLTLPIIPPWFMALAGLVTTFAAQSGDLFESLIKRVAHVKDSGSIMPGHGGMLDRLDGVYFAAPVFYAFLLWSEDLFYI